MPLMTKSIFMSLHRINNYFLSALVIFTLQSCNNQVKNEKPNVIIIFTDDQGYGDLGSYGAYQFTTPHLDKMAQEGMRFTHFYSAQGVCSASRAGLLTGCYPNRISFSGALMPWSKHGLHEDETTIAEMLQKNLEISRFLILR